MQVPVGRPLLHRRRLLHDVEGQAPPRLPGRHGLDERARGELAVPHGADALALDACAKGERNTQGAQNDWQTSATSAASSEYFAIMSAKPVAT